MVTVFRAHGLRVIIFVDDHQPAHVHVFGDGHAKINLSGADSTPELVWAEGMTRAEIRRAMRIVIEQQTKLLEQYVIGLNRQTSIQSHEIARQKTWSACVITQSTLARWEDIHG